jgi:hypothetical protein
MPVQSARLASRLDAISARDAPTPGELADEEWLHDVAGVLRGDAPRARTLRAETKGWEDVHERPSAAKSGG